jgi:hypothetical protein
VLSPTQPVCPSPCWLIGRNIFRGWGAPQGAASETDATLVDSSANRPRNEMIFEHVAPSCYLCGPFSVLLEQSASASQDVYEQDLYEQALDEMPAEDMHRAVLNISRVYAEICETAERIVASAPRELDHGKAADGMSAGG